MIACRLCNEPIVRRSKLPGVCAECHAVYDLGRFEEIRPRENRQRGAAADLLTKPLADEIARPAASALPSEKGEG